MRTLLLAGGLLLAGLTFRSAAHGQEVRGAFLMQDTEEPVVAGVVTLVDELGRRVARVLTDKGGHFLLRAPGAGRYRLLGERIGFETVESSLFELQAGELAHQLLASTVVPIKLEGLTVQTKPRCELLESASGDVQRLWDEARKLLTAVSLTHDTPDLLFRTRLYERDTDPRTGWVIREKEWPEWVHGAYPFRSAAAEELMGQGFIQREGGHTVYYAPDAHALLSDIFLDGHCFTLVARDAGLVGLTFRPIPSRRRLREVVGTLWLDEQSAELRRVAYLYTGLPAYTQVARPGGELVFERLESGAWVVRSWLIRMPVPFSRSGSFQQNAVLIRVSGGELLEVRRP